MVLIHVGIDDTDSKEGMCTTYVGAVVISRLKTDGIELSDYPKLIRLNPNWKMKTRGNCAVAFAVDIKKHQIHVLQETVLRTVNELAELKVDTTNPGVVFYRSDKIPSTLKEFSRKVVQDVVTIEEAESHAKKIGAEVHKFKLGRGIIGSLAAIGNTLENDWTFELIAYRVLENRGTPRKVQAESVVDLNDKTYSDTFDNLDPSTGEIRITPHTPCPILYGIRGESPKDIMKAHKIVRSLEPIERVVIFKTNQGTDEHLREGKIDEAKPYLSLIVDGVVCKDPTILTGGHVVFRVKDETGEIDCAAYEPTRQFRNEVRQLIVGDKVRVFGGIKEKPELPLTINLEKLAILELAPLLRKENPVCASCGKRMKSEGRGKGYSCKKCKIRVLISPKMVELPRGIVIKKFEVPPRARRHLSRPLVRELRVRSSRREF